MLEFRAKEDHYLTTLWRVDDDGDDAGGGGAVPSSTTDKPKLQPKVLRKKLWLFTCTNFL
jgi:hypothetical protein